MRQSATRPKKRKKLIEPRNKDSFYPEIVQPASFEAPVELEAAPPTGFTTVAPVVCCDFRRGCRSFLSVFPSVSELAWLLLAAQPLHLAELLFNLGLVESHQAAIDMALALQELRRNPPIHCACALPVP